MPGQLGQSQWEVSSPPNAKESDCLPDRNGDKSIKNAHVGGHMVSLKEMRNWFGRDGRQERPCGKCLAVDRLHFLLSQSHRPPLTAPPLSQLRQSRRPKTAVAGSKIPSLKTVFVSHRWSFAPPVCVSVCGQVTCFMSTPAALRSAGL